MTLSSDARAGRRTDSVRLVRSLKRLGTTEDGRLDVIVAGRMLLVATGIIACGAALLLQPDGRAWLLPIGCTAGMAVLLVASLFVPWASLSPRATLAFPCTVCLALIVLGAGKPGLFAPLTGLLSLCFAYIGLTQPPRTSLFAVPVASITLVVANGGLTGPVLVRILIGVCVWLVLAELLAGLTKRQDELALALRNAAHTDVLTGVSNRRDLQLRLSLARAGDALIICDLDHFKELNDTAGHEAGDRVLAEFGSVLRTCMREQDYCARYGGEEFVFLLPDTSIADALRTLDRLRRHWALLQPTVTFSSGVDICSDDRAHTATLAAADRALYAAKAAGRNTDRSNAVSASAAPVAD